MKNISKICLVMLLLACIDVVNAAKYPGQIAVTGETGGSDGSDSGIAWPSPRFVVGSGTTANCVLDRLTGLMWAKNANLFGQKNWNDALSSVIQMNKNSKAIGYKLCGFNDWRLPNVIELRSLYNYSKDNQAAWLNNQDFTDVQASRYWSSTSYAPDSSKKAWYGDSRYGHARQATKDSSYYVWPVRRVK